MAEFKHLENKLTAIARKLSKDIHLQQDLLQEMRVRIWNAKGDHTDAWYLELGKNAAKRYIERFIEPHNWCVPLETTEIEEL